MSGPPSAGDARRGGPQGPPVASDTADLLADAPCGYVATAPDGLIVAANDTFLRWTGRRRKEVVGSRRFQESLGAGGRIYHETHLAPILAVARLVRESALDLVASDGSRTPVLVNAVMDVDADGRPSAVRMAIFEVTERRAYERELLQAKRAAEAAERRAVALARTLQATLIPPRHPGIAGLDVGACYRPAGGGDEVGGDFYDVFEISEADWAVVIGDVAGKGAGAAVVTALARYTVRAAAVRGAHPSDALLTLNEVLLGERVDRFCTAALLRLRRARPACDVEMASGGHPLPLLRPLGEGVRPLGRPGALLGLLPTPPIDDTTARMEPGDCLVMYTDGITEARSGTEFYGEDHLAEAVAGGRHLGAAALAAEIVGDVVAYQAGHPRDDIAVVAIVVGDRHHGAAAPG